MEEIFKDVVGYEDYYQISNLGNLFSKRSNRILKQQTSKQGYKTVSAKILGKTVNFNIHRLVALAFLPVPEYIKDYAKLCPHGSIPVNHINGIKTDNRLENLEWCTHSENTKHAVALGLTPKPKLTHDDIIYIRENYKSRDRNFGQRALARMFGVSHPTIARALNEDLIGQVEK